MKSINGACQNQTPSKRRGVSFMKIRFHCFFVVLALLAVGNAGRAATPVFVWTNTAGGDWSNSTNWSPNQVPVSGGNVIITNPGTYTVTNASSATLGNLTLGGTNGIQTLTAVSLTLTNASMVNSNGVLNWNGGTLGGVLTVGQGGVLNITNNTSYIFSGTLTNNGTVNWSAGNLYGNANTLIDNAGLWQAQSDNQFVINSGSGQTFINTGTFRKTGGTGTTIIAWNFNTTGTMDIQSGMMDINSWTGSSELNGTLTGTANLNSSATLVVASNAVWNWAGSGTLSGTLLINSGGTLNITNNTSYIFSGVLTNSGTVNWTAGNLYGNANTLVYNAGLWLAQSDNQFVVNSGSGQAFINAGTFQKTGGTATTIIGWGFNTTGTMDVQSGLVNINNWIGNSVLNGTLSGAGSTSSGTLTVSPGSQWNWNGGNMNGTIVVATNATINWIGGGAGGSLTVNSGGTINITNNTSYIFSGVLTNSGKVNWSAGNLYGNANTLIDNAGLWQAQSDNQFVINSGSGQTFINTGTFRKTGGTGTTIIAWNFNTTGTMDIQSGMMDINSWTGSSELNGTLTGTANLNSSATLVVASNAVWNWAGSGTLSGTLLINSGGTLNITNNTSYIFSGVLTNSGTVNWTAGNLYGNANTLVYNAGLWLAQSDNQFVVNSGSGQAFINAGTLEKIGGSGTTTIAWNFNNNGGILDSQTNTISLSGNYDLTGGTLNFGINSLNNYGIINLSGSPAVLTGTLSANLNNGYVPATNSVFPVVTYSSESGTFTNFNLPVAVVWQTNYGATAFTLKVLGIQTNTAPNLLVNGDFESEPNWGGGVSYDGGETALIGSQLPGWTIETNHAVTIHISPGPYLTISSIYSANSDGEGYDGNNANFYQDFASQSEVSYALEFNWQSWGYVSTPTTSQLEVSVVDTVTSAVLFDGLYSYDGNGQPHPVHDVLANFVGTGHSLRLRIQETPQSGYNDNTFMVDNFSVTMVPSGLVAWWRAEGNALDSIGTNNGALVNGATFAPGKIGTAFSFGGSGDYVSVPSSPDVQQQNAITVTAWVYANGTPAGESGIAGTWDDLTGGNRTYLFWLNGGRLEFLISQTGGDIGRASDSLPFPTNQWVYVVGTYDGTVIRVYRDGVQVGSIPYAGQIHTNGRPFFIGRTDSGSDGSDYWKGQIDEVMIYNRALSSNEVASIYAAENGSGQPVAPLLTVSLSSGTGMTASASGHFVLASSPVVGGQPQSIAVADVNGDGKPDLMVNGLVLTNNGSGGFGSNSTYSVGTFGSTCVVAADVNGDGKPDLITANYGNTTLTVLTNNGVGVFGSNATLEVNSSPQCVVAADINGDDKPDLICASSSGARFLTVFTNNGAGGFGLSSTPVNGNVRAYSVVAADVNGDGKPDLITANFTANTLSVFTNTGTGAFGLNATDTVGSQPRSVVVADVNGDNKPDLICANTGDGTVTVLTNNGSGVFVSNATYTAGSQPRSVVAADINGDGKLDLICANAGDGTLTVLTNNGSGQFVLNATCTVGAAPYSLVAADINGDSPVDLISANEGSGTLTVLTNTAVVAAGSFKNVILSWPSPSTGFVLQQNSNLGVAGWLDVTNTPAVTNGQNQVAIPATPQNNFFRLLHP